VGESTFVRLKTISFPVRVLETDTPSALDETPEALAITLGGEDELPQGPQAFEILPDGSFVVADPLQQRLVFYDSTGTYLRDWKLDYSVDYIQLFEDNSLEIRHAYTGRVFNLNLSPSDTLSSRVANFAEVPLLEVPLRRHQAHEEVRRGIATLNKDTWTQGTVTFPGIRENSIDLYVTDRDSVIEQNSIELEVELESSSQSMISLQGLAAYQTDEVSLSELKMGLNDSTTLGNSIFAVKLEIKDADGGNGAARILPVIRAYNADSEMLGQITDIPTNYYIRPETKFQFYGRKVYQMLPRRDSIYVNVWELQ